MKCLQRSRPSTRRFAPPFGANPLPSPAAIGHSAELGAERTGETVVAGDAACLSASRGLDRYTCAVVAAGGIRDQYPERSLLGAALRAAREAAGCTTRQIPGYSSAHISQVENGRVMPSEVLVRRYIAFGGEAGRLLGLFDRAKAVRARSDDPAVRGELADAASDPYLLRRGYTLERVRDVHHFDADRRLTHISHSALLHLVYPESRYFPIRYSYDDDPRPGVASLTSSHGSRVALVDEDAVGTLYAVIDFSDAPRDPTGAVEVCWTISIQSAEVSRPTVVAGTSARLPAATIAVEFGSGQVPGDIRAFRGFDARAALGTPLANADSPVASGARRREQYFRDLEKEWWGLAWTWPN